MSESVSVECGSVFVLPGQSSDTAQAVGDLLEAYAKRALEVAEMRLPEPGLVCKKLVVTVSLED